MYRVEGCDQGPSVPCLHIDVLKYRYYSILTWGSVKFKIGYLGVLRTHLAYYNTWQSIACPRCDMRRNRLAAQKKRHLIDRPTRFGQGLLLDSPMGQARTDRRPTICSVGRWTMYNMLRMGLWDRYLQQNGPLKNCRLDCRYCRGQVRFSRAFKDGWRV